MRKVRVEISGQAFGTRVFFTDTGEEITEVTKIYISCVAGEEPTIRVSRWAKQSELYLLDKSTINGTGNVVALCPSCLRSDIHVGEHTRLKWQLSRLRRKGLWHLRWKVLRMLFGSTEDI